MMPAWWAAPVDYATQVAYFERRGLLGGVQLLVAACAVLIAVIPVVAQFSVAGPATPAARVVSMAFTISAIAWAVVWSFGPWPSRRGSIAFIVYADVGIAVVSVLDSDHLAGLFGLNLMLLVSVYAKFFDGPKLLVVHNIWAMGWALAVSLQIATGAHADPYLAVAKTLAAVAVLMATPIAVHFGLWVLRGDADAAMTDALTGLLNRRGLHLLIGGLLTNAGRGNAAVMVMVIDLDRFKDINDTYGHAVGDEVIIRTARRIRSAMRSPALVARIGGEEFVAVETAAPHHVASIAEHVREVIAAPADRAMFAAKRTGGNAAAVIDYASATEPKSPQNPR